MCHEPSSPRELAACLANLAAGGRTIRTGGRFTKDRMAGPVSGSDALITTRRLSRILRYEPADLTISVEAGITYRELSGALAEHRQMVPLDPPFSPDATIGGIVASNGSGPRRRFYGTARDMVIGMTFATLEGKLVDTGGMVVKNVAGLDMGKLMIGSFGTLAVIASVNFRVHPMPTQTRTFVWEFEKVAEAIARRDMVLKSQLQPAAIDLLKKDGLYQLVVQAGGSAAVLERYSRELPGARVVEGDLEHELWTGIRESTSAFLQAHGEGVVVRISCKLSEVGAILDALPGPAVARAANGVVYAYYAGWSALPLAYARGPETRVIEFAPEAVRQSNELWPNPGSGFAMMKEIKQMLDPRDLLNRGRLYGRL